MITGAKSDHCIVCGTSYVPNVAGVVRCPQCGLLYSAQKAGFGNSIQGMSSIAQCNYGIVADALKKVVPLGGAKILDVGSAEGGFTELMLREGADCLGLEPDRDAAREALEKKLPLELVAFEGFVGEKGSYDIIVFNDVFEHMQDPTVTLEKSRSLLKENGFILINIPVSSGFIFKMVEAAARLGIGSPYRRIWAQGLPSPHIYFYNEINLSILLAKNRCELVDKGRLIALSSQGMYRRVRSTYSPLSALFISAVACFFVLISSIFPSDVNYLLFKKNNE